MAASTVAESEIPVSRLFSRIGIQYMISSKFHDLGAITAQATTNMPINRVNLQEVIRMKYPEREKYPERSKHLDQIVRKAHLHEIRSAVATIEARRAIATLRGKV